MTTFWGVLITALLGSIAAVFVVRAVRDRMKRSTLLKFGAPATARILNVRQTGWFRSGENPEVRMVLKVMPESGPPFEAETKEYIGLIESPQFQPGCMLSVKYDPRDPKQVVVVAILLADGR